MKDGGLFAFAGLWDEWHAPDGSPLRSCTIITTSPNAIAAPIHDRMPVILRPEDEALWLDRSVTTATDLLSPCWPPTPPKRWRRMLCRVKSMHPPWTIRH